MALKNIFSFRNDVYEKLINKKDEELTLAKKELVQTQEAFKNASSKNYSGGIPNPSYNSGDLTSAFGFPKKFAETVKIIDNTSIGRNLLDYYTSLISSYEWKISYKQDSLNECPYHKEISEFIESQFDSIGGIRGFINRTIRLFMKYGMVLLTPIIKLKMHKFSFQDKEILTPFIESFKFWDPIGIYRFYSKEDDNEKCAGVQYLSMPRLILDKDGHESQTNSEMINITSENSLLGFASLDNEGGDFMGTSFFKDIYGDWRVLINLQSTVNQQLITIGEHSYQFIPHAGIEYSQIQEMTIQTEIQKFTDSQGGFYYSQYGKWEKIESMDLEKYTSYQSEVSKEILRRKGLNIEALGQSSGASRNLAQFAQADSNMRAMSISTQFALQISESFVKDYCNSFLSTFLLFRVIKDTPNLTYNIDDGTTVTSVNNDKKPINKLDATDDTEVELTALINNNAVIIQDKNKTYIKGNLNPYDEYVINTSELDSVLLDIENEVSRFYVEEMSKYLTNPKIIEKLVENPNDIINKKTLSNEDQKNFTNGLYSIIYVAVERMLQEEVNRFERAFILRNQTFEEEMRMSKNSFIEKERRNILKSRDIKEYIDNQLASFLNELDNTLVRQRQFTSNMLSEDKAQGYSTLTKDLANIKGENFKKLAPIATIGLMQLTNSIFINRIKDKDFSLVRSGVLENQCSVCSQYMGITYKWNGNKWVGDKEYKKLPDKDCLGGANCKCFYVQIPLDQIEIANRIRGSGL